MERKKYRPGQRTAESFRNLPERAQEIWFQYCDVSLRYKKFESLAFLQLCPWDYSDCKSPIEIIFNFAYDLIIFSEGAMGFWLQPQYEVQYKSKHYYLDFAFITEDIDEMIDIKHPEFKLAIECDGHDFHERTKEQVTKDNEREYDLKMSGFDVLRFSGSQIYNKPFRCAAQAYEYIMKKIGDGE